METTKGNFLSTRDEKSERGEDEKGHEKGELTFEDVVLYTTHRVKGGPGP